MDSESCERSLGDYGDGYFMNPYMISGGETDSTTGSINSPRLEFSELNTFNMLDYTTDLSSVNSDEGARLTLNVPQEKDDDEGDVAATETIDEIQLKPDPGMIPLTPPSFFEYNYYANQLANMPISFPVNPSLQQLADNFQNSVSEDSIVPAASTWQNTTPPRDPTPEIEDEPEPDAPAFSDVDSISPESLEAANRLLAGKRACPVCGKEFKVNHGLRGHYTRVHMRQKRFTCSVCQLGFWSNSDLERHMPRHTGQRFTCDSCDRTYTSKQRLTEHFRNPSPCWLDPVFLKHVTESSDVQRFL